MGWAHGGDRRSSSLWMLGQEYSIRPQYLVIITRELNQKQYKGIQIFHLISVIENKHKQMKATFIMLRRNVKKGK